VNEHATIDEAVFITARVQLKKSLVMGLKGLDTKTN
jgi:hypothetical protein